jgi:hypothetical protein
MPNSEDEGRVLALSLLSDEMRPHELLFGNHIYNVLWESEDWAAASGMEGFEPTAWAFTSHMRCMIFIRPGQTESQKRDSLLHEVLHVVNHQFGVNIDEIKGSDVNLDEVWVSAQTPWLLLALRSNPYLLAWLTA